MGAVSEQAKERKKDYDKSYYLRMSPEKKAEYNARDRANRKGKRKLSAEELQKEHMLRDLLMAKTPAEKRKVIEGFAPHYFLLTPSQAELRRRKAEQYEQARMD